jgi:excisionase family DNA binding protein
MESTELSDRPHLKVDEAAQYLRIHPATVRRLMRDGQLQGVKLGKRWFIARNSLVALVEGTKE